jgi:hypothetical protein
MDFDQTHLHDLEDQRPVGAFPLDIHHFHIPPLLLQQQAEIPVPNFAAVGHSLRPPYCYYQMGDRRDRAWQLPIADLVHHHKKTLVAVVVVVEHTWPWLLDDLVLGEQATVVAGEVLVLDEADGHMGRRLFIVERDKEANNEKQISQTVTPRTKKDLPAPSISGY